MKLDLKVRIRKRGAILSLSVIAASVLADYITKLLVMHNMELGESIPLIKNVLHITYITNDGAAFGSFSEARWLFMTVSVVLIVFLSALLILYDEPSPLFQTAVSLIIGGGIGNMIDRIFYGVVIDFIDFCAFPELWKWIFNGADSFVCIGVGLLIVYYIRTEIKCARQKKAAGDGERDKNGLDDYNDKTGGSAQ